MDDVDHKHQDRIDLLIDQQFANLRTMLSCGLTRVATVMLGGGNVVHHHLGHSDEHHYSWISVANRMGVGITSFGDPSHVHGPLPFL